MSSDQLNLSTTVSCLCAIARCHRRLEEFVAQLKARTGVSDVTHWTRLYDLKAAFRIDESIGAELDKEAIDWGIEITGYEGVLHVEAEIRCVHDRGQDLIRAIADHTFEEVDDFTTSLAQIVEDLCDLSSIPGFHF